MVIWSENVLKENLILELSSSKEILVEKVPGCWLIDKLQYKNGLTDQL